MRVKEESKKTGLKLNIQKTKIMASGPITSWQIDGKIMETVTDFIFLGSKITADGNCIHEIKRPLLLERKAVTNVDSILKKNLAYNSILTKIVASSPITSWQIEGETVEALTDLFSRTPKSLLIVTAAMGKIEGKRKRGQQMRLLNGITNSMDMKLNKLQEIVKERRAWHTAVLGVT